MSGGTSVDPEPDPPYTEERLGQTGVLVTKCPGCSSAYVIDEFHWDYPRVKTALDRGDRSVLVCYHQIDVAGLTPRSD